MNKGTSSLLTCLYLNRRVKCMKYFLEEKEKNDSSVYSRRVVKRLRFVVMALAE